MGHVSFHPALESLPLCVNHINRETRKRIGIFRAHIAEKRKKSRNVNGNGGRRKKITKQMRAERRKKRGRGKHSDESKPNIDGMPFQQNVPGEKDSETTFRNTTRVLEIHLADKISRRELDKNDLKASKAGKLAEEKEDYRRHEELALELNKGRQMLELSLKRKTPEISANIADRPRVFSKSARVDKSTGAETTSEQKKKPPAFREIWSSPLRKISRDPMGSDRLDLST